MQCIAYRGPFLYHFCGNSQPSRRHVSAYATPIWLQPSVPTRDHTGATSPPARLQQKSAASTARLGVTIQGTLNPDQISPAFLCALFVSETISLSHRLPFINLWRTRLSFPLLWNNLLCAVGLSAKGAILDVLPPLLCRRPHPDPNRRVPPPPRVARLRRAFWDRASRFPNREWAIEFPLAGEIR